MSTPGGSWATVNAALLAARNLGDLPEDDARALLALLHAGTLVETDAAAMRALDLQRLAWSRQLAGGELDSHESERAAMRLLALGHREPARGLLAASPSPALVGAWADWTGEGPEGAGAASTLVLDGLALAPAPRRSELRISVTEPLPARLGVRRLRVGAAVLDVEVRRRPGGLRIGITRTHGPGLAVTVELPPRFESVMVDEVEGLAPPLRFELRDRHEVVAYG